MPEEKGPEVEALYRSVLDLASKAFAIVQPDMQVDIAQSLPPAKDPIQHAYLIASMLGLDVTKDQTLLEAPTPDQWGQASSVVGKYRSGEPNNDVARNHDEYLAGIFAEHG